MTDYWEAVFTVAARQEQTIARRQALHIGMPSSTWHRYTARRWTELQPGVALLPAAPRTPMAEQWAAWLALAQLDGDVVGSSGSLRSRVAVARWSALWRHGLLRTAPTVVHLLARRGQSIPVGLRRAKVHSSRNYVDADRDDQAAPPLTTVARTLADVAGRTDSVFLRALLIDARAQRGTDCGEVLAVAARLRNADGTALLREVVPQVDAEGSDSVMEDHLRRLVATAGLPPPYPTPYPVVTGRRTVHLDVAWPDYWVACDCLSMAFHSSRTDLDTDALRLTGVAFTPWRIIPVTWTRLRADAAGIVADIRHALALGPRATLSADAVTGGADAQVRD